MTIHYHPELRCSHTRNQKGPDLFHYLDVTDAMICKAKSLDIFDTAGDHVGDLLSVDRAPAASKKCTPVTPHVRLIYPTELLALIQRVDTLRSKILVLHTYLLVSIREQYESVHDSKGSIVFVDIRMKSELLAVGFFPNKWSKDRLNVYVPLVVNHLKLQPTSAVIPLGRLVGERRLTRAR